MPEEALDELAAVWNLAMDTGRIPQAWLEVRTVTIPKQDGGLPRVVHSSAKLEGLHELGHLHAAALGRRLAT